MADGHLAVGCLDVDVAGALERQDVLDELGHRLLAAVVGVRSRVATPVRFTDRAAAGRALGAEVARYLDEAGLSDRPLVLALPRGGVPVAASVVAAVGGELDIVVVRKIGTPGRPELGVGAIAEDGPAVFDDEMLAYAGLTAAELAGRVERERAELERRVRRYRGDRPAPDPAGRVVVVVDDGLATGVSARAALRWVRGQRPRHVVLAVPVGAQRSCAAMTRAADAVLCLHAADPFRAVGPYYRDFRQLTDEDVDRALR